ncbi:aluminum-activated malate transporter 2-like [Andrographis paniculata]|uniref:aluminum-activated malate transporter 2-like n=1 Tax=Andrographis paniculata TaxID=175694 RepID=UPI0021E877B4|nr:aluminum-activated malate transporter 2-like [Andrographis paniculata]
MEMIRQLKKIGNEDPRRVVHSIKVGLSLTLVSLLYYFRPLYDGFGQAGMWAILTVVVVSEFTVGGTLSRSLNRSVATLVAGGLGVGVEYFSGLFGEKGEPVVLGLLVFTLAAGSTFVRFFPKVKGRYDYGVLIFILTFSLVAVSGVRVSEILKLAHQRLSTILIGGVTCILVSLCICPVWAGQDLHNLTASNIGNLALFFQGLADEFDDNSGVSTKEGDKKINSYLQSPTSVLNSKATEESLANFAWWEPCHGEFKFNHPWQQYLKVGCATRDCAYKIQALCVCINNFNTIIINYKSSSQGASSSSSSSSDKFAPLFVKISREVSSFLKELAAAMKDMRVPNPINSSSSSSMKNLSTAAADEVRAIYLMLSEKVGVEEILPLLVISSLLLDIINSLDKVALLVRQLSLKGGFRKPNLPQKLQSNCDHVVVEIHSLEAARNTTTQSQTQ